MGVLRTLLDRADHILDRLGLREERWLHQQVGLDSRACGVGLFARRDEVLELEILVYAVPPDTVGPGGTDDTEITGDGETVTAEMQGTILEINVEVGDEVAAGDVICVLEAMKMENDVVAERGGEVTQVAVAEEDSVDMGDVLVVLE